MPRGSARYFARALILLFAWVFLAIPGFIAGAIVGRFVPGDPGRVAAFAVMVAGGIVSAYFCVRTWLVFPAIAIGDDEVDFRRSFELTKGFVRPIVVGTLIAYLPFVLMTVVTIGGNEVAADLYPEGTLYVAAMLLSEFAEMFLLSVALAASAGVLAEIYRDAVPSALPNPRQIAVFE